MLHSLKKRLYLTAALYFAFWAKIVLRRWRPRIIVVTGSSGKTTLLHMVEAQVGDKAVYSHGANSAMGITFHILGLGSNVPSKPAWLLYFIKAPFHVLRKLPEQKLYVVEADCSRPNEGKFGARLLRPETVLWISVFRTHSMDFDRLVKAGRFQTHEQAIAHEFGNLVSSATKLIIANGDQPLIQEQLKRAGTGVNIQTVTDKAISKYELLANDTKFTVNSSELALPGLHPRTAGLGLQIVAKLLEYLGLPLDPSFAKFQTPPGRNNVLAGQKSTVIIDSTYNTGLGATEAVLGMFEQYQNPHKWLVIADILEQGGVEQEEHEQLAQLLAKAKVDQIILLGRRNKAYAYPVLQKLLPNIPVMAFDSPGEVLEYVKTHTQGGEAILFKGAQGLEGVIEQLLANPSDAGKLVRREPVWVKRRQQWGLPR